MNENAPTLPIASMQPNMNPGAAPVAGQPQPLQFDFSEGDSKEVSTTRSGAGFEPGQYLWSITAAEFRKSKDPKLGGTMLAIFEGVVLKNLSPDGNGAPAGAKRSIVLKQSNEFAFYPTIRKILAALQGIADPNQTRTNAFNDMLNSPATYYGVGLNLNVSQRQAKSTGNLYPVYDFDGAASQDEVDAFLATNPQIAGVAVPNGTRTQQGLGSSADHFTTK